jgi:hypothetical protein
MLKRYANQTMVHQHRLSKDVYNQPTYQTQNIKGRKEPKYRLVTNPQGEVIPSTSFVMTESVVEVGDLIDGRLVVQVDAIPNLRGIIEFYEVLLS